MSKKLPRVSASALTRVINCPGSVHLPQYDETSEYAERGTIIHTYLELCVTHDQAYALDKTPPEFRKDCLEIDLGQLPFDLKLVVPERRFVYDPATGEVSIGDHPKGNECFSGQADVILEPGTDNGLEVYDYKTGQKRERAKNSWQLKFLAFAAARYYGVDSAVAAMVYTPGIDVDRAEFNQADFDIIKATLDSLPGNLAAAEGTKDYKSGEWCRYCPGIMSCPSMMRAVSIAAGLDKDRYIGDNLIPIVKDASSAMKAVSARLNKVIYVASFKGVEADGRKFSMDYSQGPARLDPLTVETVLMSMAPDAAFSDFGQVKYTKTSIEKGCKSWGIDQKKVMAEILAEGGLQREQKKTPIEEPSEQAAEEASNEGNEA